MHSQYYELEST